MNTVKSENRTSYPRILPSVRRLLLPLLHKCQVIQMLLRALIAYRFVGQAHGTWDGMRHMEHGTGWSRTQYACFVRVVFFCPRSEVWVCPRALQTILPTCQGGKEVFYCKTCNWGNGDWFSGLQIATSHFIPRHFNMKKDTICASEWIC